MDADDISGDLTATLYTEAQIQQRLAELCRQIEADYEGRDLLLIGVLKGAIMVMSDLSRELRRDVEMDWMATSSYGASTESSGVVRIVKDLDLDLTGRDVLIVEDIVDSGLTLSYLRRYLQARKPASLEVCALLVRGARDVAALDLKYIGFTIADEFVIGYGLDAAERYRNLPFIADYVPGG